MQTVSEQLAEKSAQLQQACQNPLFSPEKPQPGSPSTPRDRGLTAESSSLTLQVCRPKFGLLPQSGLVALKLICLCSSPCCMLGEGHQSRKVYLLLCKLRVMREICNQGRLHSSRTRFTVYERSWSVMSVPAGHPC